jgi:hypothetical protein
MLFRTTFENDAENPTQADQTAMHNTGVLKAALGAHRVSYSLGFGGGPAIVTVEVESLDQLAQFSDLTFERDPEEAKAEAQAAADAANSPKGKKASGSDSSEPQA